MSTKIGATRIISTFKSISFVFILVLLLAYPVMQIFKQWNIFPMVPVTLSAGGNGPVKFLTGKSSLPDVILTPAFPHLEFNRPLWMIQAPDKSNRWYLLEQGGRIYVFPDKRKQKTAKVFLNLIAKTRRVHNEEGLLALAFHPQFAENRKFYLYYSASSPRRTVLSEWKVSAANPDRADEKSERVLIEVKQPWGNHNGGALVFGPDKYLYCSFGDGGSAGDPHNNGQNLNTLLASVIRIDVDHRSAKLPYAIPKDNPFTGKAETRAEIWAYGLRNVWRMSFDRETGDLWAGDVGQNKWEEIDLIVKGGNYGWKLREGFAKYSAGKAVDGVRLIDPITTYNRREGLSVTGGYVYRGKKLKRLIGAYIYADYITGRIWALRYKDGKVIDQKLILKQPNNIASFAEDNKGELYLLCFDGRIYQLQEKIY